MLDYLTQNVWLIWILISVLCLIIELGSGDLFVLCFAIGGLAASLTAAVGLGLVPQLIAMALCALLSIYFVRPVALRYLHRNDENKVSNADAILGQMGQVTQTIEKGGFGRVSAGGNDWKAVSADGERIEAGAKVRVVARESIVITVEPVITSNNS
ncbi:MAG: NfeD family protein [Prevotella sp.]|jgi:membrane protein implicated in regulation of membrane protease activity|nr:NfeD family protein [Prevotella sp.]